MPALNLIKRKRDEIYLMVHVTLLNLSRTDRYGGTVD